MKSLVLTILMLCLVGCGSKFDAGLPVEAKTTLTEKAAEDTVALGPNAKAIKESLPSLKDFEGYWISSDADKEIIQLAIEEDTTKGKQILKLYGLNLMPDFNYLSSAYAEKDNPEVLLNGTQHEALMVRTLGGAKKVIEILFDLPAEETLIITLKGNGKTVTKNFKLAPTSPELKAAMHKVQFARAQQIIHNEYGNVQHESCLTGDTFFVMYSISFQRMSCIKTWLQKHGTQEHLNTFLRKAIDENSLPMVEFFLREGADLKAAVPEGLEWLRTNQPMLSISQLPIGEHGGVRRNASREEVIALLTALTSGAKVP